MPFNLSDLVPDEGSSRPKKRVGAAPAAARARRPVAAPRGRSPAPARGIRRGFEGGQLPIQKRLPYKRGFTNIHRPRGDVVNIGDIEAHGRSGEVKLRAARRARLIRSLEFPEQCTGRRARVSRAMTISAHGLLGLGQVRIEARRWHGNGNRAD
jgi:large subunit ribosomal protein L15